MKYALCEICPAYERCTVEYGNYKCPALLNSSKQISNADRIRAMSNEELANITIKRLKVSVESLIFQQTYICSDGRTYDDYALAYEHEVEWLQQIIEEGSNG